MRTGKKIAKASESTAAHIGRGLLAGIVGTAAITLAQTLEMKASGRQSSDAPEKAAEEVFGVEPKNEAAKERVNYLMHFAYGTTWGLFRGGLDALGIRGKAASALHMMAITATGMFILPKLGIMSPVSDWSGKQIAKDSLNHAVYASAVGAAYDNMKKVA